MWIYTAKAKIFDYENSHSVEKTDKIILAADSYGDAANKIADYYGEDLCYIEFLCEQEDLITIDELNDIEELK